MSTYSNETCGNLISDEYYLNIYFTDLITIIFYGLLIFNQNVIVAKTYAI